MPGAFMDAGAYDNFGVISKDLPTEDECALSTSLEEALRSRDNFETQEQLGRRIEVLRKINVLVKEFVKKVSSAKMAPEECERLGGKLFTFGSYRLGVHTKDADIDSLCVVPRNVSRADFFNTFVQMLKEQPETSDLHAVEDAFAPLIKMKFAGFELDVLFARLSLKEVPDNLTLDDDSLLKNLEIRCIRSLNGCRVADEILKLVPNKGCFAITLRAIKLWAKNHGIYSNIVGFFGGITWAILVARTCQLYPLAVPARLIHAFFYVFSNWEWPSPVLLKEVTDESQTDIPSLTDYVWDPRLRPSDRFHLMPIITPAFPQQNSTYNVSASTQKVLLKEFKLAYELTGKILKHEATWDDFFEPINFFSSYRHFLVVIALAETEPDKVIWSGFVESKLRHFIGKLDQNRAIKTCHINPTQYRLKKPYQFPCIDIEHFSCSAFFIGLEFETSMARSVDLSNELRFFTEFIDHKRHFYKQNGAPAHNEHMLLQIVHVTKKELHLWLSRSDLTYGRGLYKTPKSTPKHDDQATGSASTSSPLPTSASSSLSNQSATTHEENTDSTIEPDSIEGSDLSGTPKSRNLKRRSIIPETVQPAEKLSRNGSDTNVQNLSGAKQDITRHEEIENLSSVESNTQQNSAISKTHDLKCRSAVPDITESLEKVLTDGDDLAEIKSRGSPKILPVEYDETSFQEAPDCLEIEQNLAAHTSDAVLLVDVSSDELP